MNHVFGLKKAVMMALTCCSNRGFLLEITRRLPICVDGNNVEFLMMREVWVFLVSDVELIINTDYVSQLN